MSINSCPLCGSNSSSIVFQLENAPVFHLMLRRDKLDKQHFASLKIVICQDCKHMYNKAYDENLNVTMYEEYALTNVPVNISMTKNLERIADFIGKENYRDKIVLEIGAGGGYLARIFARDASSLILFEPSKRLNKNMVLEKNIQIINCLFTSSFVNNPVDLIVCRHVMEHVLYPLSFIAEICKSLSSQGHLYLEVPRAEYIDRNSSIINFQYPHIHYFNEPNIFKLIKNAGLVVKKKWYLNKENDIGILASFSTVQEMIPEFSKELFLNFAERLNYRVKQGNTFLKNMNKKIAIYGAAWHGVMFLNNFNTVTSFSLALDDNNDYSGKEIFSKTQSISIYKPTEEIIKDIEIIIITAYLHEKEIMKKLKELNYSGRLVRVDPELSYY